MVIYPAIDVKNAKCVRLCQDNCEKNIDTIYSDRPIEVGLKCEKFGAQYLHVIDLDGARYGKPQNIAVISELAVNLGIPIQVGGGIKDIETIEIVLCKGIERIILGTSVVNDEALLKTALDTFKNNIVVAIDAKDALVELDGWTKSSKFKVLDFTKRLEQMGAKTIIYTDISKNSIVDPLNLNIIEEIVNNVNVNVIAAGGINNINDVKTLKDTGIHGVIIGKALYTGDIKLQEAVAISKDVVSVN